MEKIRAYLQQRREQAAEIARHRRWVDGQRVNSNEHSGRGRHQPRVDRRGRVRSAW